MASIHVLNGPNLNLLGTREPEVYGNETITDIERRCRRTALELGFELVFRQSNHEGELITWLHEAGSAVAVGDCAGVVFNPAAYTHSSVALRDAIAGAAVPVVEVHLTNVHAREPFRNHSHISPVARGAIVGLGPHGYELAIRYFQET